MHMQVKKYLVVGVVGLLLTAAVACSKDPETEKQAYFASGNALYEQGKYADAIVEYRNALQADPKFGEARLKLAEAYVKAGDTRRAGQEYIRASDLLPGSAEAQLKAGSLLLLAGRFEDAKSRAEKALKAEPRNVEAQILLGNATAGLKDIDGALTEMEEAVALAPGDARAYTALGAVQLAKGQADEAEKTFRQAVAVEPNVVGARLALAQFLWAANRRDEAQVALEEALKLEPTNKLANRALAAFHVTGRDPRVAEPYLKALAADPKDTDARVALGDFYMRTGQAAQAREVLTKAAAERAGFSAARVRLAAIAYADKNATEAHRLLEEVLGKNPKDVQALLTKSRLLRLEGNPREALTSAQAAAAAAPESAPAVYERALVELSLSQYEEGVKSLRDVIRLNPRAVDARVQLASTLLRQRDAAAALPVAEDALRNAPENPAARLVLARAQMASGNVNAASATLGALQKQYPDAGIVWSQLGALNVMQRNNAGARAAFERALQLQPGQYQALQGLTLLDIAEGKGDAARGRIEALVAKAPGDLGYQQIAAKVYVAQRDFAKAESLLRAMLARDSTNLETYGLLGQVYLMQNKTEQALKEYDALSKQQPGAVGPHTVVAMLLQSMDRLDEAQQRYERVIQLDRQAPVAANNLAWLYAERGGNLDVALQLAQTARRILPNQPAVADTLGWVYYKKQQYDLAIRELQDAVEKDPDNPEYQYHLGAAYAAAGDVTKARTALQKAVARPFAASEDARRALNALPSQGV